VKNFFLQYDLSDEVIAAGVSGGADSLALVLRLKKYCKKVVALSVDHKLREESAAEAEYVAGLMKKEGIEHHILVWEGEKPKTGIEAAAREARYNLLCGWCKNNKIKYLAVGHHRRDQAETFLLRLQRGSGLSGLCGMLPIFEQNEIFIIRPQLNDDPQELKAYLQQRNIKWVEDPSNQSDDFLRVKVRKFLPELEKKIGISEERLSETANVLQRTRSYFAEEVDKRIRNQVRKWGSSIFSFSSMVFAGWHSEIAYRVLAEILRKVSKKNYAPESDEILHLIKVLNQPNFKGCTLNGCEVFAAKKRLWVIPEIRKNQIMKKLQWEEYLQKFPQYAKADLPYKVRRALYNESQGV